MKDIVGEHPKRRKRRLRALAALGAHKRNANKIAWLGMHQNNSYGTRQEPSLPHITMRVVDWDVQPVRRTR